MSELSNRESIYEHIAWKEPKLFGVNGSLLTKKLDADWLYVIVFRYPLSIAIHNKNTRGQELDYELSGAVNNNTKLVEFYLEVKTQSLLPYFI